MPKRDVTTGTTAVTLRDRRVCYLHLCPQAVDAATPRRDVVKRHGRSDPTTAVDRAEEGAGVALHQRDPLAAHHARRLRQRLLRERLHVLPQRHRRPAALAGPCEGVTTHRSDGGQRSDGLPGAQGR
eukprot:4137485-Pyramimonas_sp.AAC.3